MDIFIPYLFLLHLLPFSLYLIFFFLREASASRNLPPGSTGWPVLGEHIALARSGISKFVSDRMLRYSTDVFQTSLWGETIMVFCGAQGNKLIFTRDGTGVALWRPLSLKKVLFPDFDSTNHDTAMAVFRHYPLESLRPEALRRYVPAMDAVAGHRLRRDWGPNSSVEAVPLLNRYTFEASCKAFLNVEDEERLKKLWEPFAALRGGLLTVPVDLPGTALRRGVEAGERMRREMRRIVEARRKEVVAAGDDLLSKIVVLSDDDESIARFFVGLLVASYDSTATALVSVVYFLAQLPHIYQGVFQEQMAIAKSKGTGENLTWEDVEKMKYSWNVVRETLRLASPVPGTFREATSNISYAGFTIYKGMKVFWTPHSTHKNPDYFPEPEKFYPSRFKGSGPAPYTFVPFGGGARICPGRGYAKLAILVFMHNLVTSFRFEKAIPHEKLAVHVTPKPTHGLLLRLYSQI